MRLGGRGRQGSSASSLFNPASDKVEGGKQFGATIIPPASSTRLSVDSCAPAERRASINSTTSSLRPISVTSSISGVSTADSRRVSESSSLGVGSILAGRQHRASTQSKKSWDDGVLEREKEKVRRESLESTMRRESMDSQRTSGESTRRSSLDPKQKEEARRRTALGDVFPELASAPGSRRTSGVSEEGAASKRSSRSSTSRDGRFKYPILTIEEATNDGHSVDDRSLHGYDRGSSGDYEYAFNSGQATFGACDETRVEGDEIRAATSLGFAPVDTSVDTLSTPLKKARQRPRSEQLLGGFGKSRSLGPVDVMGTGSSRPGALYEDDDGVLSVLSAATNDLEKFINVLDLQATPCTPDLTPLKPSLSPYASEPSSVVSNQLLNTSLVSMDRMSSITSLRAFAAASASNMPSSFKKESDTRTQSNKTKSNSKNLSKSKQIKALCNASPTAKKSTSVNSVLSLGSTNAANTATIRASGGVKAMVARLNEQSSQSQLSSLFNHGSQRKTSTSSQLTCRSSVSSLNSVAGSVRLGPYKQSCKPSGRPAGGLAGLFGGGSTTNMSKVEEGSLEVDEDDIVAEVMKTAESKVKRDEEEKRKVDEKKAEEAERQKATEEESEKSRSPSTLARKHKHKRTMTPGPEPEPAPVSQPRQLPRRNESGCPPGAEGTKPSQCLTFGHPQALEGVPHPPQGRFLRQFWRRERPEWPLRYHSRLQGQQTIVDEQTRSRTPTRRG
ncbi:hypothetical protein BKA70DRAFT_388689 [Coprinopsis sp. MPI-PUGE-AT-0042]|nr:hypothetical protein BKA70DRAFT_388689 [Coprinopsis sp. MPI-PUGE-AT-0042]